MEVDVTMYECTDIHFLCCWNKGNFIAITPITNCCILHVQLIWYIYINVQLRLYICICTFVGVFVSAFTAPWSMLRQNVESHFVVNTAGLNKHWNFAVGRINCSRSSKFINYLILNFTFKIVWSNCLS